MAAPVYGVDVPVQHSWPDLTCFGCGPANEEGLQIESYLGPDRETLVAAVGPHPTFTSGAPNVAWGGYVASLVDCHSVWTAITFAHEDEGRPLESDPHVEYVTGQLSVEYRAPTPLDEPLRLRAWVEGEVGRKTTVRSEVGPEGETTATGEVVAVRVDSESGSSRHYGADEG
jgi:hypothetical protein